MGYVNGINDPTGSVNRDLSSKITTLHTVLQLEYQVQKHSPLNLIHRLVFKKKLNTKRFGNWVPFRGKLTAALYTWPLFLEQWMCYEVQRLSGSTYQLRTNNDAGLRSYTQRTTPIMALYLP